MDNAPLICSNPKCYPLSARRITAVKKSLSAFCRNRCLPLVLGLGLATLLSAANAATYDTWFGGADGKWSTDANWSTFQGAYPSSVFDCGLVFDSHGGARLTTTNDIVGRGFDGLLIYTNGYHIKGNAFGISTVLLASFPTSFSTIDPGITFNGGRIEVDQAASLLALNGPITVNNTSLTVTNNGLLASAGAWSGVGTYSVNFVGSGTTELEANVSAYPGVMNFASPGTLIVFGAWSNATFNVSGTLNSGNVLGHVSMTGGQLQPGYSFSIGQMTILTNLTASSGATFSFRLSGSVPGTDYDQVRIAASNATVSLGNAQLVLHPSGNPIAGATFTLIDMAGTTNKVSGTFAGWPEGSQQFVGNAFYKISYAGGDGNDVVVTVQNPTSIWKGSPTSSTWSVSSNWLNNIFPQQDFDVAFPVAPQNFSVVNNVLFTEYNHLIFQGSNYHLSGLTFALKGGILVSNANTANYLDSGLTLAANQTFSNLFFGLLIITNLAPGTNSLALEGGAYQFSSIQAGTGSITYDGAGTVQFFGTNTHTGPVHFNGGFCFVQGDCSSQSIMTFSNATLRGNSRSGPVALVAPNAILNPGNGLNTLTIGGSAQLTNGTVSYTISGPATNNSFNRLVVEGPLTITTNCQLTLNMFYIPYIGESYTWITNTSPLPISGQFNNLPEGATLVVSNQPLRVSYRGGDGNDLTITAIPSPHIWDGTGASAVWSLAANWISNSPPSANDGMVFPAFVVANSPTNDFPAYTRFESLTVSNLYTFYGNPVELTGGFRIDASATFNPAVRLALGQVWNVGSNFYLNGAVDIATNLLNFAGPGNVVFSNNVTGTTGGVLCLNALSSLTFNGTNNFSGALRMLGGALANNGPQLNSPIKLDQADWFVASGALISNCAVAFVGGDSNVAQFNGRMVNGTLAFGGGSFTVGSGAVVSNCLITLSNGTLAVFGQAPLSGIALSGGTLSGTGTVANVTASGGTISPGAGPGQLRTGSLLLGPAVTLDMQIAGSTAGVNYDQVQVAGSVNLNGASLHLSLVDQTLNIGDVVILIDNDGGDAIVGTFAGLPEGSIFPLGLLDVKISYVGGSGNDVSLTVVAKIPRATWTGLGSSNDWSTATNWSRNTLPLDDDNLYFPQVAANLVNFNSLGSTSYATLFIGGSNYNIQAGNVALTGGIIATNPTGTNLVDSVLPTISSTVSNIAGNTLILTGVYRDAPLNFQLGGSLEFRGDFAGGSNVVMAGNGVLHIYNTNPAFQGSFTLQGGLTEANTTNSFGNQGANSITISNGATLVMRAAGEYGSSFFLGGTQHIATAGTVILDGGHILTSSNSSYFVDAGASLTLNGIVSGAYGLRKDGPGEMFLTLTNFYTGGTLVNGGTLYVSGVPTNAPAGALNVNNGATLRGRGPCGPIFVNNGVLAPGYNDLHASLSSHDGISMSSQSTYRVRISNVPAANYDNIAVNGPVVLVSPQLQLVMDFRPPVGSSFTLIDNDGADPIIGTFASLPQNSFYTNGPTVFRILYNGGTGNDIVAVADHFLSTGITRTWTGAGTNALWSNAQNWATNIAPHSGDAIYFPPGALQLTNQNDFASNTFFHAVTIGGVNYRLTGNLVAVIGGCTATNTSGLNTVAFPVAILTNMPFRCEAPGATLAFESPVDNNSRRLLLGGSGTVLGMGPVIGLGDLEQTGPGVAELRGTNTYVGETKVSGGRLRFQNSPLGLVGGGVVITNNAILELSGTTNVTEDFTVSGTILFTNAAFSSIQGNFDFPTNKTATFNVASGTLAGLFPSFTHDGGGPIKEGLGDLYIAAGDLKKDVYTGPALINKGRVIFDSQTKGLASDFGTFIVNSGATLAATGQVNQIVVNTGGTLAPGLFSGVGPLIVAGNLSFSPGSTLSVDLQGVTPDVDFDTILAMGSVNLGNANLNVTLGYTAVLDSQYQIITSATLNPILGTFAGLGEGTTFFTGGAACQITYVGGDGNDVVLRLVASPPSIKSFASLPNGSKQIVGTAQPGWFALIEAADSLTPPINWQLLDVQIPDGSGIVSYTDTDATNHPVRFYRISAP